MLDRHTLLVLQAGWQTLIDDRVMFHDLYPIASDSEIESWRAAFKKHPVVFKAAFAPGEEELPLCVVQLSSESVEVQPLGGVGGWTPNQSTGSVTMSSAGVPSHASGVRDYFHYGIRQNVNISCYTEHPDLTRSLHYGLRAVMFAAQDWFLGSGYSTIEYQSASDLTTELELLFGYVRQMSWSALRMEQITGVSRLAHSISVHMNDIVVAGVTGGTIALNE
jgi:hypothetical protein